MGKRLRRRARVLAGRASLSLALLAGVHRTGWASAPSGVVPAAPEPPPAPDAASASSREKAQTLFREGLALLDAGSYAPALERFESAYEAWRNPKILLNIATVQRALGQLSRAANNYARYMRTAAPEQSRAAEVAQILATLDAGLGRLVFANLDAHHRVWLNDQELSVGPDQQIRIEPGEYTMRIAQPGSPLETRAIAVWPGEVLRVEAARPRARTSVAPVGVHEDQPSKPELQTVRGSRLHLVARADVDVERQGGVGALGAAVSVRQFLRVTGGALVGVHQGLWLGVELIPSRHWIGPVLGLSSPMFFVQGIRPGVAAELGLRVEAARWLAPFARVSVIHFSKVPGDYVRTLFIPSVGMEVGL